MSRKFLDRWLRRFPPEKFNREPNALDIVNFSVTPGTCLMTIVDDTLTTASSGTDLNIDLDGKTVDDVRVLINAVGGYTCSILEAEFTDKDADCFMETDSQDITTSPTDVIQVAESYLWILGTGEDDAFQTVEDDWDEAAKQVDFKNSSDKFTDFWGQDLFGFDRETGESDADYSDRVIDIILEGKVEGRGLAESLKRSLGLVNSGVIVRDSQGTFIIDDFTNSKLMTFGDNGIVARHILGFSSIPADVVVQIFQATGENIIPPLNTEKFLIITVNVAIIIP